MSLRDVMFKGRPRPGAMNRMPSVPIVGQSPQQKALEHLFDAPFFSEIGIIAIQPPTPGQPATETTPDVPARGYLVQLGGMRSDKKGVGTTVEIAPNTPTEHVIRQMGLALNFLMTYRRCSCPDGIRCELHQPPKSSSDSDKPKIVIP